MIKVVLKEILIMLLLLSAIILGLGVLLYDYIPSAKVVPRVSRYETPSNIHEELQETITNTDKEVIITYQVDSKDLNIYEKSKEYNAGNPNPFKYYTTQTSNTDSNENTSNNSNNTSSNTSNTSNGTFFENKGTK